MGGEHDIVMTIPESNIYEAAELECGLNRDDIDWEVIEKIVTDHVLNSKDLDDKLKTALKLMKLRTLS
jgi:hypothetical protein